MSFYLILYFLHVLSFNPLFSFNSYCIEKLLEPGFSAENILLFLLPTCILYIQCKEMEEIKNKETLY